MQSSTRQEALEWLLNNASFPFGKTEQASEMFRIVGEALVKQRRSRPKFVIVESTEGGADIFEGLSAAYVKQHLGKRHEWSEALAVFNEAIPFPGWWMQYPCGWVFCVLPS